MYMLSIWWYVPLISAPNMVSWYFPVRRGTNCINEFFSNQCEFTLGDWVPRTIEVKVYIFEVTSVSQWFRARTIECCGSYFLRCELYSLGFSKFMPWGASVRRVWVHFDSTLRRIVEACGLLGGFLMNSKTVIWISFL